MYIYINYHLSYDKHQFTIIYILSNDQKYNAMLTISQNIIENSTRM